MLIIFQSSSYHRVAFYGGWVKSLSTRQFIYYNSTIRSTDEIIQETLKKFTGSLLLADSNIPSAEIQTSDQKYIQITPVVLEAGSSVSNDNLVDTFSFVRSLRDESDKAGDVLSHRTEKTVNGPILLGVELYWQIQRDRSLFVKPDSHLYLIAWKSISYKLRL